MTGNATTGLAPTYDDGQVYSVKLTRVVYSGGAKLLPRPVHEMTGAVLNAIVAEYGPEAIDTAQAKE